MNTNTNLAANLTKNSATIININDIKSKNPEFEKWLSTPYAKQAFQEYQNMMDRKAKLIACGSICANCHMQDLSTAMCMEGHLQRITGIPVTSCKDFN